MISYEYRAVARGALKGNWGMAVLVTFVAGLLGASTGIAHNLYSSAATNAGGTQSDNVASYTHMQVSGNPAIRNMVFAIMAVVGIVAGIYAIVVFILGGAIKLGLCNYNMLLVQHVPQQGFTTLFSKLSLFGKALLLQLVTGFFVFLWSLLFIIPGIVAMFRYAMAPYIMAQNPDIGVMEAIRQSKEMMRGHKWQLFVLQLSFIGWAFLCLFTLGLGYLWLNPYIGAANAAFYLQLTGQLPLAQGTAYPAV